MKLLGKFNIAFIGVFGCGIAVAGYLSHQFLEDNARDEVMRQAGLMMETALASRTYTEAQLDPLLETLQRQRKEFLAQTIPFYAATETFGYVRKKYPLYTYKEAALNPSNLRDRAVDWEADIINVFRNHRDRKEFAGDRETPDGRAIFLARPIVATTDCLECHGRPAAAPRPLIKVYGPEHGFGWNANEVIGAQIVSVPEALPISIANRAFGSLMIYLGVVGLGTMLILDIAMITIVIRPVKQLSHIADDVSKGNLDAPALPARGNDEIATLAGSFNRMYLSLKKAIQMLENQ